MAEATKITWVAVPLSQAEFARFNRESILAAPTTSWAVMRQKMGMQASPVKLRRAAIHRMLHPDGHFITLEEDPTDDRPAARGTR